MNVGDTHGGTESTESPLPENETAIPDSPRQSVTSRIRHALSYKRIGAVYVFIVIVIVFTAWVPSVFPQLDTARQIANGNAVTGLAVLALIVPLAAGIYDLSFAYTMSLCGVTTAHFVAIGWGIVPAVAIALGVGVAIGLISGFIVVGMKIDSFIATLASGSLIQALITFVTGDNVIVSSNFDGPFVALARTEIAGLTLPVFYLLVGTVGVWYLLEHSVTGRRLYATGFSREAARLAGIRTERLRVLSLIFSGVMAAFAGIILASSISTGSPTAGPPYLLPVFAAAFLGATQITPGRFNARGSLIAVILLGTGVTGLGLANAPAWTGAMFTGVVLIAALAVASLERRRPEVAGRRLRGQAAESP